MNFDPKSSSFLLRTHCWQRFVYLWRWQKNRCWELSSRKDFLLNCRAHSHLKASSISASVSWCFSSPAAARLFLDSPLPVSTYRLVTVLGRCSRQDFSNGRTLPCSLCWVGKTLSDMHCGLRLSHSRSFLPLLIFAGVSISPPHLTLSSVQFSSVTQSCPTLCDPMDGSTPGLPVHRQLPEFTQTHVHPGGDAIQPSHPLSSPSPLTFNLSQHQGLFQWVSSSHQVAKVLEFQLQHQSSPSINLLQI